MAETVHILCDNGSVMAHDLPLPSGIADRVARGQLKLVNEDGSDVGAVPAVVDSDEVPAGSIATVVGWVGEDRDRAERALSAEQSAEKPRVTLVAALTTLLEG